jgi:vacuolar protein sorting-associated protein 26
MDGSPIKGSQILSLDKIIPIRKYLKGFEITPSHQKIKNKFYIKYFLNIILIDDERR